jgi:hypothetical protein
VAQKGQSPPVPFSQAWQVFVVPSQVIEWLEVFLVQLEVPVQERNHSLVNGGTGQS